jgi:LssY C-terminus
MPGAVSIVPAGTVLYLRLQTPVSTKTSKNGQRITATVEREVALAGGVAVPAGAVLTGKIKKCTQPATPQDHAELLLSFSKLAIPGEPSSGISGRISAVSNARESVQPDGTIQGVLETDAPATLLKGGLAKLAEMSPEIAKEIHKEKIGDVDTSIEYPAGVDVQFALTQPLAIRSLLPSRPPPALPDDLSQSIAKLLAVAPERALSKEQRPGDPLNVVVIGTAQQIKQAFLKAGWAEPSSRNGKGILDTAIAVMNDGGFGAAPVSDLYVYGRKEDLAFEKMLNTFSKRHHLRLWLSPDHAPDGRPIWLGAATHDTGIDVHPGVVSHSTDPDLDDERAQVRADLSGAGRVQALQLVSPPHPLSTGYIATGGAWRTDGRLLVIAISPSISTSASR